MRQLKYIVLVLFVTLSCDDNEKYENEIVFFFNVNNPELLSDYNYHIEQIQKHYSDKGIKVSEIKNRIYNSRNKQISIKSDQNFAVILIDKNERYKIFYTFGTDVDLMIDINKFFNIK